MAVIVIEIVFNEKIHLERGVSSRRAQAGAERHLRSYSGRSEGTSSPGNLQIQCLLCLRSQDSHRKEDSGNQGTLQRPTPMSCTKLTGNRFSRCFGFQPGLWGFFAWHLINLAIIRLPVAFVRVIGKEVLIGIRGFY